MVVDYDLAKGVNGLAYYSLSRILEGNQIINSSEISLMQTAIAPRCTAPLRCIERWLSAFGPYARQNVIKKEKVMKNLLLFVLALQIIICSACMKNVSIEEKNKAVVRKWFEEVINKKNLDAMTKYAAPEFVNGDNGQTLDEFKKDCQMFFAAFPDLHVTIEMQIAEGDMVALRWTWRGTHKGAFMGMAATGKRVTVTGMNISRLINGKYVKDWGNWDTLGLLEQLKSEKR